MGPGRARGHIERLPLLYVLGLRREWEPTGFPVQGVDGGSVSMLAVRKGRTL